MVFLRSQGHSVQVPGIEDHVLGINNRNLETFEVRSSYHSLRCFATCMDATQPRADSMCPRSLVGSVGTPVLLNEMNQLSFAQPRADSMCLWSPVAAPVSRSGSLHVF